MDSTLRVRQLALGSLLALFTVIFASSLRGAVPVQALVNCDVGDTNIDGEEQAFLGIINGYRASAGAQPLTITGPLTRAAVWLAVDMGAKNYFSHTDLLGRDHATRLNECDVPGWDSSGENIAAGQAPAQATFTTWQNSPGHNENMLNGTFAGIGIARINRPGSTYGWYWVTTFSADASGGPAGGGGAVQAQAPPAAPPPPPAPPPPSCSNVSVASNQPSTVAPNTPVVLTANAACPANPSFQWWGAFVFPNGGEIWQELTAYGAPARFTWTPTAPGNYLLGVWAKVAGTSPQGGFDKSSMIRITVAQPGPAPCTSPVLSPQGSSIKARTVVRFSASATCGGTAEYQFWLAKVTNGVPEWKSASDFSTNKEMTWIPSEPGTYLVGLWAKNQGSTPAGGYQVSVTNQFTVVP